MSFDFAALQKTVQNNSNYWKRYSDTVNSLSQEQKIFVNKQQSVLLAKEKMYAAFIDYLFEQNKDFFVSCADGKYKVFVDDYINEIKKAADSYISKEELLEKENQELKEQLRLILGAKNNDTMAANGTRRTGKTDINTSVRTDNDTGKNSKNLELF